MRELVMKSENWELLKEYLSGDPAAERELFARYDRDFEVPQDLWGRIETQITPVGRSSFNWWAGIAAGLVLVIGLLSVFLLSRAREESIAVLTLPEPPPVIV